MTRTIRLILTFLLLILLGGVKSMAQSAMPEGLQERWATFRNTYLPEKIFVHTDKDYYLSGEICWFKCYDVSALSQRPLDLSKIAYLEVLDTAGKPVLQAKVALAGGSGSGSFYLPFTLVSGHYTLRSYTSWMKNSPAGFFFQKKLTIINTRETGTGPSSHTPPPPVETVAFFPEGGNLVNGLLSTVAFKGTDVYGDPIDFGGVLMDEQGDTVLHFAPMALGMGRFSFTPAAGHKYRALIRPAGPIGAAATSMADPAVAPFTIDLPEAYADGYVMHLDTSADRMITLDVSTTRTGEQMLYLFIHTRGSLKIAEGKAPADGHVRFRIDPDKLGEGVSQLTIFNSARQPVCERLYFKYPRDTTQLIVQTDRTEYGERDPVNIKVQTGGPQADMSMAVYRLDSLQNVDPANIYSYLWLTSDLSGPVNDPNYYFGGVAASSGQATEKALAMDNLMLTQGWRRFRWESVLGDKKPSFTYPPEFDGHIISGTIVDTRTGKPTPDMEGFVSVPGKRSLFATSMSDSLGHIAFEIRRMFGSSEIIVQTDLSVDSMFRIDVDDPFFQDYSHHSYPAFSLPLGNPVTVSEHSLSMQVQNAYEAMKVQQLSLPSLDSSAFYLTPDLTYKLDDYTRFTTMEEVLREYIQLVNVSRRGVHFHIWTYDAPHLGPFNDDPLVLLDGVPIFNLDQFMTYDPFRIRKADVVTRRYFLGRSFFDGIVNWVTYKGDLSGYQLDPHATAVDYDGLQDKREFYSPVYATPTEKASRLPDFRNVLYWNPSVKAGQNAGGALRFYTSDLPGKYVIVVEGVGKGGEPLYGSATLDVQP